MQYERHPAWSVLLRLFHWCFALSIVVLVTTGFYIHYPWTNTMVIDGSTGFPVATMRYIHFLAGFVFTAALLVRLYLLIFGNRQERFWDFLPITPRNIKNLFATLKYYLYLTDEHDHRLGHNALAGMAYFVTFLVALLQIISGLYLLYPESAFWQKWGFAVFGPQQQGRWIHYLIMWYFIFFAAVHLYIVIWNDIRSKEGLISSIFNGTKYTPKGALKN
jgi:Ni/Fe-hydrogenase 1 B-type cytochrome subunit